MRKELHTEKSTVSGVNNKHLQLLLIYRSLPEAVLLPVVSEIMTSQLEVRAFLELLAKLDCTDCMDSPPTRNVCSGPQSRLSELALPSKQGLQDHRARFLVQKAGGTA